MPGTVQNAGGEGVALVHSLYGERVGGGQGINDGNPDVQPAGLHSTAPYRPPKRHLEGNPDKKLLCSYEDCKAYPTKTTPYCAGHSRKLGLVEYPPRGPGKKGTDVDDS